MKLRNPKNKPASTVEEFALKEIQLDQEEPILLATFLLPFNIERDDKGEFIIKECFHNPTMLYATFQNFLNTKKFNFKWVGLVTTLEDMTDVEKQKLENKFRAMNAYPIFMTVAEIAPY